MYGFWGFFVLGCPSSGSDKSFLQEEVVKKQAHGECLPVGLRLCGFFQLLEFGV